MNILVASPSALVGDASHRWRDWPIRLATVASRSKLRPMMLARFPVLDKDLLELARQYIRTEAKIPSIEAVFRDRDEGTPKPAVTQPGEGSCGLARHKPTASPLPSTYPRIWHGWGGVTERASAADLAKLEAVLTRSDLAELGYERAPSMRSSGDVPVEVWEGYSRPMIRISEFLEWRERSTYRGDRVRPVGGGIR